MSEDLIGARKGDYEILSVLGTGGMGKVYKVRNVLSDRIEAMKVLLPNLADQKYLADRFLREIKVLASLSHPNIAGLRTALMLDNQLVMIMEYVEGTTLSTRLEQGAIPWEEALNYVDQVLAALGYAHQLQIIHRDIKPSNMMLTSEGVIKLMDFGIARSGPDRGLTMTGTTLGSLSYMSPEQVKCEPIDSRSDLYSVGVSLYEMVTGQRPFQADSNFAIMQAHLQEPARMPLELKPDLPVGVGNIIMMAMQKDPSQRFQSADAFRNALQSVAGEPVASSPSVQSVPVTQSSPAPQTVRRSAATIPLAGVQAGGSLATPGSPAGMEQAAVMPPQQVNGKGHRGLYITLGALIVLAALVAAGFSVPRWFKTRANQGAVSPTDTTSAGHPGSSTQGSPPVNPNSVPVPPGPGGAESVNPAANPQPAGDTRQQNSGASHRLQSFASPNVVQGQPSPSTDKQQTESAAAAQPASPDPAQLDALELEMDQLSSRAAAVSASLENLQRQQNAQGLQLRGDISASQQRMQTYMAKAQSAVQAQDVAHARKYLDLMTVEVDRLENFLGR